jgi:hypothetical protein
MPQSSSRHLLLALWLAAGCSSASTPSSPSAGGAPGSGGATISPTGGSISQTGGAVGSGGLSSPTGGATATGGSTARGGTTGVGGGGGSVASSGGSTARGGTTGSGGSGGSGGSFANPDAATDVVPARDSAVRLDAPANQDVAPPPPDTAKADSPPARDGTSPNQDVAIPNDAKKILYVGPQGADSNPGTQAEPFATIPHAVSLAQPGTLIYVLDGTYAISAPVNIDSPAGTATDPIRLWAYPGAKVILDFASATGAGKGLSVNASYWHVKGLVVTNCPGRGIQVMKGDHITIEFCETHHNGDMGLVVSEGATNALILNCDSHHNIDVENNGENADGFGAKSNLGAGTIFRGCRAWANSDDGWDLYNCPSAVRFENCWSYKNGENFMNLPTFAGDGNGFKLGKSDFTTSHHVLVNTVAFGNLGGNGFEDNANASGLTFYNCVAYGNPKAGFEAITVATHVLKNNLSYKNGKPDNILAGSDASNNSWNGMTVTDADFASLDDSVITGPRNPDGSLPATDFLKLRPSSSLIDKGVDVGLPYQGAAPDLGAFECR